MNPNVRSQLFESLFMGNNFLNGIIKVSEELEKDLSTQKREKSQAVNLFFSEILIQNNFTWFKCCLIVYCAIHESIDPQESDLISLKLADKFKYFMDTHGMSSFENMANIFDVKWYMKFQIEANIIFRILAKLCLILKLVYTPMNVIDQTNPNGKILIMIRQILESLFTHYQANTRRQIGEFFVDKNKLATMRDADEADLQSKLKEMLSLKNLNEHLYSVANRPKISNEENDHHQQQPEKPQELQHQQQQQQQHISSISTQGRRKKRSSMESSHPSTSSSMDYYDRVISDDSDTNDNQPGLAHRSKHLKTEPIETEKTPDQFIQLQQQETHTIEHMLDEPVTNISQLTNHEPNVENVPIQEIIQQEETQPMLNQIQNEIDLNIIHQAPILNILQQEPDVNITQRHEPIIGDHITEPVQNVVMEPEPVVINVSAGHKSTTESIEVKKEKVDVVTVVSDLNLNKKNTDDDGDSDEIIFLEEIKTPPKVNGTRKTKSPNLKKNVHHNNTIVNDVIVNGSSVNLDGNGSNNINNDSVVIENDRQKDANGKSDGNTNNDSILIVDDGQRKDRGNNNNDSIIMEDYVRNGNGNGNNNDSIVIEGYGRTYERTETREVRRCILSPKEKSCSIQRSTDLIVDYDLMRFLNREFSDVQETTCVIIHRKHRIKMSTLNLSIFRPYAKLKDLKITECGVQVLLGPLRFNWFKSIRSLSIVSNEIEYLDERMFLELNNLEEINFSANKIAELSSNIFKGLTKLKFVNFSRNRLRLVPSDIFRDTICIEDIDFSHNCISTLSPTIFKNLKSVSRIYIFDNQIESLDKEIFKGLFKLRHLKLNYNHLRQLDEFLFADLENLSYLNFGFNRIETLPPYIFATLGHLEFLIGSNNRICDLHENLFIQTVNLHMIDFSYNKIRYMGKHLFKNQKSLTKIDLTCNRIRFIYEDDFFNFKNIRTRQFSENPNLKIIALEH